MILELWTRDINPTHLAECLKAVTDITTADAFYVMEIAWWDRPTEMLAFNDGLAELQITPEDSLRGSAFGPNLEIRWREINGKIRVVIFSEMPLPGLEKVDPQVSWKSISPKSIGWDMKSSNNRSVLLWGSEFNPDHTWSELRIGRPLNYPVAHQNGKVSGVHLKIVEYLNTSGQVVLARRSGLYAMSPGLPVSTSYPNPKTSEEK